VNASEAKSILLLYRPGTADEEDPEIAEALALMKSSPELARWLAMHSQCQLATSQKFRQIKVPAGLMEQIISEQSASERMILRPQTVRLSLAALILLCGTLAFFWHPQRAAEVTLTVFQRQMVGVALRGYSMDLLTHDPQTVRSYLARRHAPADFVLPESLKQAELVGCAVEGWQGANVSMICFRTGKPLAPGAVSDLWLFVVDRTAVGDSPEGAAARFSKINRLITASWNRDGKYYLLGTEGEESAIKHFL
jgi:hypothetical protein